MSGILFLGKPMDYWLALDLLARDNNLNSDLISENIVLRGKLSFVQSKLDEMSEVLNER